MGSDFLEGSILETKNHSVWQESLNLETRVNGFLKATDFGMKNYSENNRRYRLRGILCL